MHKLLYICTFIGALLFFQSEAPESFFTPIADEDKLAEVLVELGDAPLPHQVDMSIEGVSGDSA